MCLKSFKRPGLGILPCSNHNFLESPPFQCLVVNPRISVFMLHLSSVLPMISAHMAAVVIDLPLIDPELSTKIETRVSLNSESFSILKLSGVRGSTIIL